MSGAPERKSKPADAVTVARRDIDEADRQVLRLLGRRFEAVRRIAALKQQESGCSFQDHQRERQLLDTWSAEAESLGIPSPLAKEVLRGILRYSRRVQEPLLEGTDDETQKQDRRRTRPRVAIQGVDGSNSALATAQLFSTRASAGAQVVGFHTFPEAVEALEEGRVEYALLPVENSISGSILDVHRLICDRSLFAVDEEVWSVDHVVAALPGASIDRVHTVRSHPAALAQCERFLRKQGVELREPWFDTAGAAESLVEDGRDDVAAICSAEAAARLGLAVLRRGVADRDRNETRFLLLATRAEDPDPRLACKTSIFFRLNHHEGALARMLQAFADAGANLLRIESRPNVDTPWEYRFLVDLEGHKDEPRLAEGLRRARRYCNHLRIVGTYPRRTHRRSACDAPNSPRPSVRVTDSGDVDTPLDGPAGDRSNDAESRQTRPTPVGGCPPATDSATRAHPAMLTELGPTRERSTVRIGNATIGGNRFTLIAGPCAVESRRQIFDAAKLVHAAGAAILRGGAYKPRTSPYSFQGLGVEGLRHLRDAGRELGIPVVTEVVKIENIPDVLEYADMIQVGARNMQNFPLLRELGQVDRPILLKRGMSATVKELLLAAEYILAAGNQQVVLCERGIRTFETATRSTLDISAVPVLRRRTHLPIIVDPSHAAGDRELVIPLAVAAVAAGADGLIVEAHPRPEEALCDREQALTAKQVTEMVEQLDAIVRAQGRQWS